MILDDTIAAISSAVGPSPRMIVRLSGQSAQPITSKIAPDLTEKTKPSAARTHLHFAALTVPAWLYMFKSPHSYTGDDLIEFHIPGNPLLARMLLDEIISLGARQADPGEFTARAYFNGKMDLSQAEGVAAAISATSGEHLAAAQHLMAGELSHRLRPVINRLAHTLALVEVGIDFSEEDVEFLSADQVRAQIDDIATALDDLIASSARFEKLSHEPRVVLAGRPNAGKSTLLNALAQTERAVVSPIAGTTRDVLSTQVMLRRGAIWLIDAAGLEESTTKNDIESQMRDRAFREIQSADVVVLVRDVTDESKPINLNRQPDLIVYSKLDLNSRSVSDLLPPLVLRGRVGVGADLEQLNRAEKPPPQSSPGVPGEEEMRPTGKSIAINSHANPHAGYSSTILVSAKTGEGLDDLRSALDAAAFGSEAAASTLALNARHVRAIKAALAALAQARANVAASAAELVSADLREALDRLGEVLGTISPDEILGRIFSTFCIGK